jgi:hypothetical protein
MVARRSILGPALGGALAQPCLNYPAVFSRGTIFDAFPFLLPNLVCTIILAGGVLVGILFLEETHEELKDRRDYGLELGRWALDRVWRRPTPKISAYSKAVEAGMDDGIQLLLEEDSPPGYCTTENSPRQPSSRAQSPAKSEKRPKPAAQKAFTRQVIVNIVGYGLLA